MCMSKRIHILQNVHFAEVVLLVLSQKPLSYGRAKDSLSMKFHFYVCLLWADCIVWFYKKSGAIWTNKSENPKALVFSKAIF